MKSKIFFLLLAMSNVYADELWLGQTYDIVEPNAILEIQNILIRDKEKISKKLETMKKNAKWKIKNYRPKNAVDLPSCKNNHVWFTDLSYANEFDEIPNVPKGTLIYPLKYISIPYDILLVNGKSEDEIKWLKTKDYDDLLKHVWISNGNFIDLQTGLQKKIYYYNKTLQKRIKMNCTPSIIKQVNNMWQITEIKLKRK